MFDFRIASLTTLILLGFVPTVDVTPSWADESANDKVSAEVTAVADAAAVADTSKADKASDTAAEADKAAAANPNNPAANPAAERDLEPADATKHWKEVGWPLMQRFCVDCHNADNPEAEWDLSSFENLDEVGGGANSMQRVLEMVRFSAMPPEDADLPTEAERKQLIAALDQTIFAVSCDLRPRPGKVTARRLNRAEYNHTIRDLFGIDLRPADRFPSDEVGAGFDNNSDVLSMSPLLMEKYLEAAEIVSEAVVIDPDKVEKLDEVWPSDQLLTHGDLKVGSFFGLFMKPGGVVWANFDVKLPGEYTVTVRGGAAAKGVKSLTAGVFNNRGILVGTTELKHFGSGGSGSSGTFKIQLEPGKQRLMATLFDSGEPLEIGKTYRKDFDNLNPEWAKKAEQAAKTPLKPDRGINEDEYSQLFRSLSVKGPAVLPDSVYPPSQKQIVRKTASRKGSSWKNVDEAAIECLRPLMRRAFRGPVSDQEIKPYVSLVSSATERGESYYRGLQIAVSAVLVSPRFLYRIETPADDWKPSPDDLIDDPSGEGELNSVALTQHQLASRLSYFLWSSMPDDQLLDLADKGKLVGPELQKQIDRMLKDPKSRSLATQFAAQWLGIRKLNQHEADTKQFASFTPTLKEAMIRETESVVEHIVRSNRPVGELLTADYTFVNAELAKHYGLTGKDLPKFDGDNFARVSLAGTPRRGLLGHASVLTLTSNPNRTSPVGRGKWILENIFGTPPPDPPPGVPELGETKTAGADATFREQLELHRADPACASCHRVMDQLGFGLEQFDPVGQFRTVEGKLPIDASGELPGRRQFNGAVELTSILGETETESFARTVATRLLTFALGRELTPADRCTVDAMVEKTAKDNYRFDDLIVEVIMSRPFQFYDWRIDETGLTTTATVTSAADHTDTELN
ncbi:hypothetical protein K227x_37430 [Rubripirellula lacrimiformis]|uniref:Planctomycete cytochrome C n=1 Tax=Rubripirellula lacrimiformis TaxID=1930273 RepID=A0A517NDY5_9BACT|nr:DUF1592 domain-containing protein [Rubripirellula lacrimiformis]QDT05343.1 hypothetical protein K227x_37430 [Rubripirellula lacrimiformis]